MADPLDALQRLQSEWPTMSAASLVAFGLMIGGAVSWFVLRPTLQYQDRLISILRDAVDSKIAPDTALQAIGKPRSSRRVLFLMFVILVLIALSILATMFFGSRKTSYEYRNEMNIENSARTIGALKKIFKGRKITMTITAQDYWFQRDFYAMILASCEAPGDCLIEPPPKFDTEIDTVIAPPKYSGIVVHHKPVNDKIVENLMAALGGCFIVHKSESLPDRIAQLNVNNTLIFSGLN